MPFVKVKTFDRDHIEVTVFEPFHQNTATVLSLSEDKAVHSNFDHDDLPSRAKTNEPKDIAGFCFRNGTNLKTNANWKLDINSCNVATYRTNLTLKDHFTIENDEIAIAKTALYIKQLNQSGDSVVYKVDITVGASFSIKSEYLTFEIPIIQQHRITFEMPVNMSVVDIQPLDDDDTNVYFSTEPRPCNSSQSVQIEYRGIGRNTHTFNITLAEMCGADSINATVLTISYVVHCAETLWTSVSQSGTMVPIDINLHNTTHMAIKELPCNTH